MQLTLLELGFLLKACNEALCIPRRANEVLICLDIFEMSQLIQYCQKIFA